MSQLHRPPLAALTGLRYLAFVLFALGFLAAPLPHFTGKFTLIQVSGISVTLFFVLSGFLLTYHYADAFSHSIKPGLRSYLAARFARVYPVYILGVLLSFSFGTFFHDLSPRPEDACKCLFRVATMTQNWLHVPVFQGTSSPRTIALSYLPVASSISSLCFFYLLFPLVAFYVLRRIRTPRQAAFGIFCLAIAYLLTDMGLAHWFPTPASYGFPPPDASNLAASMAEWFPTPGTYSFRHWVHLLSPYTLFGEFLAGCLVGKMFLLNLQTSHSRREQEWGPLTANLGLPALLVLAYYTGKTFTEGSGLHLFFQTFGLAPACLAMIYCLARYESVVQKFFASYPLVKLGEGTFCLYLLLPLLQSYAAPRLLGEGELTGWSVIIYNHLTMLVVLHLVCLALYHYFEEPMRHWLRNLFGVQKPQVRPPARDIDTAIMILPRAA